MATKTKYNICPSVSSHISNGAKQKPQQNMLICRQILRISNYYFILTDMKVVAPLIQSFEEKSG